MKQANFMEIGLQLKAIRERLNMTLDDVSKEIKISRSYICDFEKGRKLPTSRYLKYLHDNYNVDLHYIFLSGGHMFRPTEEEQVQLNFGKFQEEIDELLHFMHRIPHALYAVLGFFTEYKIKFKTLINEYSLPEKENHSQ